MDEKEKTDENDQSHENDQNNQSHENDQNDQNHDNDQIDNEDNISEEERVKKIWDAFPAPNPPISSGVYVEILFLYH